MSTLSRFFHFHEGNPGERAMKVGGAFLAALALTVTAGAVAHITAQQSPPGAPVIAGIQAAAGQDSATISWSTDTPAIGGLVWGTDSQEARRASGRELSHVTTLDPNPAVAGARAITLTGLTANTTYYFYVEMTNGRTDAQGRELRSRSAEQTFRTRAAPAAATPPPPLPAALQGCQDSITPGPTTRTLRPGVAGQDTVCISTGQLMQHVRLVRHNIARGEYSGSAFEVITDLCNAIASGSVEISNIGTRQATVGGVRITFTSPTTIAADAPIAVTVSDARVPIVLDTLARVRNTDLAVIASQGMSPETYIKVSPSSAVGVSRSGRSRTIRTSPHIQSCAIALGNPPITPLTLATTQPLELVPGMGLYAGSASVRAIGSAVEARFRVTRTIPRPIIAPDLVVTSVSKDAIYAGQYHVAVCNLGLADAGSDITVTANFSGAGADAYTERYGILGGIPVGACRDAHVGDRGSRSATTIAVTASAAGLQESDTQNNDLTATFSAGGAQ